MQFRCPLFGLGPMRNVFLSEIIIPNARDLMKPSWLDLLNWVEHCNQSLTIVTARISAKLIFLATCFHCMKKAAPTNMFFLYCYAINNFLSVIIATVIIIIIIIIIIIYIIVIIIIIVISPLLPVVYELFIDRIKSFPFSFTLG